MSETLSGSFRSYRSPEPNCNDCRLGSLTVPCSLDDVRQLTPGGGLRAYRTNVVLGQGGIPCSIMLVGEAPGMQEDREGRPFVETAPAGRVLKQAMDEVGLCRFYPGRCATHGAYVPYARINGELENSVCRPVYLANVVKCRPLDNKIDKFPDAVEVCREHYLEPEIEAVDPKVIVFLGKTAAKNWFGAMPSLAYRQEGKRLLIHAPHPSNIARGARENRWKLIEALRVAKVEAYGHG